MRQGGKACQGFLFPAGGHLFSCRVVVSGPWLVTLLCPEPGGGESSGREDGMGVVGGRARAQSLLSTSRAQANSSLPVSNLSPSSRRFCSRTLLSFLPRTFFPFFLCPSFLQPHAFSSARAQLKCYLLQEAHFHAKAGACVSCAALGLLSPCTRPSVE